MQESHNDWTKETIAAQATAYANQFDHMNEDEILVNLEPKRTKPRSAAR